MTLLRGIRHPARFVWRGLLQPCLGWLLLGWLTLLVPKRRGQAAVFGLSGQFADNSKYFFLHLAEDARHQRHVRYLSDSPDLTAALQSAGLPVLHYPSLGGLWYLLRSEVVVVDASSWVRPLRYQVSWRARKVQLWHGIPLKRIELDDEKSRPPGVSRLLALSQWLIGRFPRYEMVLSPSPRFTEVAFRSAFDPVRVIEDDFPRNVVFHRRDARFEIGMDRAAAEAVARAKRAGLQVVFYMPTFRDTGGDAIADGALDPARLDRFAAAHGFQFVVKLHPVSATRLALAGLSRIVTYGERADIYPLLPQCDVLVTDYSSVFFDFLRTGRPIVFFPYDLEKYQTRDRSLYFNYEDLVPGPIGRTQDEVEASLRMANTHNADDAYASRRADLLAWCFARADGDASERIAQRIWEAGATPFADLGTGSR